MFAHVIVYIVLSILSATAVYAMGNPIGKSHPEQAQSERDEKGDQNTL